MNRPIPWRAEGAKGAGTVHFGVDNDGFVDYAADLSVGRLPKAPFALFGQMTTADPTRSPAGTESAWAYTHVPHGIDWTDDRVAEHVQRVQDSLERLAPGFADSIVGRHIQSPLDLEAANANLVGGATNGGTAGLHQQLFFRPHRAPAGPRPRSPGCSWPAHRHTRAAGCTAPADGTPPSPHSAAPAGPGRCAAG